MKPTNDHIFYFSQAQPASRKPGDTAGLFRWVAKGIEESGDITVVDVVFQPALDNSEDEHPSLGVFYKHNEAGVDKYRIKSITYRLKGKVYIADMLSGMADRAREIGLSAADTVGITFHQGMDKEGTDEYVMTLYF